jgi:hypothetical protein
MDEYTCLFDEAQKVHLYESSVYAFGSTKEERESKDKRGEVNLFLMIKFDIPWLE